MISNVSTLTDPVLRMADLVGCSVALVCINIYSVHLDDDLGNCLIHNACFQKIVISRVVVYFNLIISHTLSFMICIHM